MANWQIMDWHGVYGLEIHRGELELLKRLETGMVWVNTWLHRDLRVLVHQG